MTETAMKLEAEMKRLPLADLLALHEQLVVSIHERGEAEPLEPGFRDDIVRRVQEIDAGKTEGVDAFKALKEL
jgi:hypothetical protein